MPLVRVVPSGPPLFLVWFGFPFPLVDGNMTNGKGKGKRETIFDDNMTTAFGLNCRRHVVVVILLLAAEMYLAKHLGEVAV